MPDVNSNAPLSGRGKRLPAAELGVVIPAFQAEAWISEALSSLQSQTLQDWVAIVVDDGSSDRTAVIALEFAERDPRIVVVTQENAGVAAARNTGVRELPAEVDLVAFLDADDRYDPPALDELKDALQKRPDAVGIYALARYIDAAGRELSARHDAVQRDRRRLEGHRFVSEPADADATFDSLIAKNPIWPSAVALHRLDTVRAVGGTDESMRVQQDWDLYLRMSRRGPFAVLPRILVDYRRHETNATVTGEHTFQNDWMRWKAFRSPLSSGRERRAARRAWRYLELRQGLAQLRQVLPAAEGHHIRAGARLLLGGVVSGATAIRLGVPRPSRRRSRLTGQHPFVAETWDEMDGHRKAS